MDKSAALLGLLTLLLLPLGGCGEKEGSSEVEGVDVVQDGVAESDDQIERLTAELDESKSRLAAAERQMGELLDVVEERLPGFEAKREEAENLEEEFRSAVEAMERGDAEMARRLQEAIDANEGFKELMEAIHPIGPLPEDLVGGLNRVLEKMAELEAENAMLSEKLREKGEGLEGGGGER